MDAPIIEAFPEASPDALEPHLVVGWTGDPFFDDRMVPPGYRLSWEQPICERCWVTRRGFQQPVRAWSGERAGAAICAFCGRPTWAGIYQRADPRRVPYPALEEQR